MIDAISVTSADGRYCRFCNSDGCYSSNPCPQRELADKVNEVIEALGKLDRTIDEVDDDIRRLRRKLEDRE